MGRINLDAALQAALRGGTPPAPYTERLETLNGIARSLQANLAANAPPGQQIDLQVAVVPGYAVNRGQQFNVVCRIPGRNFESTLFKVYIPSRGDPVHFDFYGEQMIPANGNAEMEERFVEFVQQPDVANRLLTLRQMATR